MGANRRGGDVGFFGAVGADAGEQVQGGVPVRPRTAGVVQSRVGVDEAVMGAGLVGGLVEFDGGS